MRNAWERLAEWVDKELVSILLVAGLVFLVVVVMALSVDALRAQDDALDLETRISQLEARVERMQAMLAVEVVAGCQNEVMLWSMFSVMSSPTFEEAVEVCIALRRAWADNLMNPEDPPEDP